MYPVQLALLGAEALVMALVVFGLFRNRALAGRSPLYVVLGGFLYLAVSWTQRVEVAPGWTLQPATTLVFGATLATVLLIYISHDARATRKLVGSLVLGNAGLTLLALVVAQHVRIPGDALPLGLATAPLLREGGLAIGRALGLYALLIGLILAYEFVSRLTPWLFARAVVAIAAVGTVAAAGFTLLAHWERPDVLRVMTADVAGSLAAAAIYGSMLWAYLRWVEPVAGTSTGTGDVSDVLQELTYRQLYEQARSRLTRDALTGVHNRGYFDEAFARAVAQAARYGEHLSVIIADADHFKAINDRHSHLTGDKVLKVFAATLVECARASDVVCRYGGDEFVVILPNADLGSARAFAQRFRQRLTTRAFAADAALDAIVITATVGIASLRDDGAIDAPDDLLRRADNRLYVGKRAGRDRVVWEDLPVSSVQ
jgi:diguanylate cyclase (GGDEF)-like protein